MPDGKSHWLPKEKGMTIDLIDMMHTHPFIADGGSEMQFNLVFPRPRMHRVWVQFQRDGVINTVHFDVPVNKGASSPVASN